MNVRRILIGGQDPVIVLGVIDLGTGSIRNRSNREMIDERDSLVTEPAGLGQPAGLDGRNC